MSMIELTKICQFCNKTLTRVENNCNRFKMELSIVCWCQMLNVGCWWLLLTVEDYYCL